MSLVYLESVTCIKQWQNDTKALSTDKRGYKKQKRKETAGSDSSPFPSLISSFTEEENEGEITGEGQEREADRE